MTSCFLSVSFLEQRLLALEARYGRELQGLESEKQQLQELLERQNRLVSQWEVLACFCLKQSDKLSNNSKRSCVLVVTCLLTTLLCFRLKLALCVILNFLAKVFLAHLQVHTQCFGLVTCDLDYF